MKIRVEIDAKAIRKLVLDHIRESMPGVAFNPDAVQIEVKSKQNYKSEWESAAFRAVYEADA